MTQILRWRVGIDIFKHAGELLLPLLADVFQHTAHLLKMLHRVLTLMQQQTGNLRIVIRQLLTERSCLRLVLVAHFLEELHVHPIRNLDVTPLSLFEMHS